MTLEKGESRGCNRTTSKRLLRWLVTIYAFSWSSNVDGMNEQNGEVQLAFYTGNNVVKHFEKVIQEAAPNEKENTYA